MKMGNQRASFSCHACGTEVEYCAEETPCGVLKGWVSIAYWKGAGSIVRYNFCSLSCLKSWVDARIPQIPRVFLESFKEEEG